MSRPKVRHPTMRGLRPAVQSFAGLCLKVFMATCQFCRISTCPPRPLSLNGSTETWPSGRRRSPA